jgi:branched-chain amino acid transport system ATP-binding protein
MQAKMIVEARNLTKRFGGLTAVSNVSFGLEKGEILGIIGPNGAGKTTILNIMSGFFAPTQGEVIFKKEKISGLAAHQFYKRKIGRTFQLAKPFGEMTTLENVMVGAFIRAGKREEAEAIAMETIRLVGLEKCSNVVGYDLTVVDRKKLELARCLAGQPELVLLDEVIAGCTPKEMEEMLSIFRRLNDSGLTIVMVEHVMKAVMTLCQRIVVLDFGEKIAEGPPKEIVNDKRVIEAYLGATYGTA